MILRVHFAIKNCTSEQSTMCSEQTVILIQTIMFDLSHLLLLIFQMLCVFDHKLTDDDPHL